MSNAPLPAPVEAISLERLAACVRRLDPGSRALLDLSVHRGLRDDAMAPLLRTDPFHLAWRRARALERVADALDADPQPSLTDVRAALAELPDEVWSPLPQLMPPRPAGPSLALVIRDGTAADSGRELAPVERRQRFRRGSLRAALRRALRRRAHTERA